MQSSEDSLRAPRHLRPVVGTPSRRGAVTKALDSFALYPHPALPPDCTAHLHLLRHTGSLLSRALHTRLRTTTSLPFAALRPTPVLAPTRRSQHSAASTQLTYRTLWFCCRGHPTYTTCAPAPIPLAVPFSLSSLLGSPHRLALLVHRRAAPAFPSAAHGTLPCAAPPAHLLPWLPSVPHWVWFWIVVIRWLQQFSLQLDLCVHGLLGNWVARLR